MQDGSGPVTAPDRTPHLPGWLVLLGVVVAIGPLSIDMYLPSLPAIADDLGVPRGEVERSVAAYLTGVAFGQLAYGPLSDRFGRRPPLLAGLVIYILGCLGCAFAASVDALVACRVLQALGGSAGMVIARAVVRDRTEGPALARAFSALTLVMGAAPILAPLAGGLVLHFAGWRAIFGFQALFALGCLVAVAMTMTETRPIVAALRLKASRVLQTYARMARDRHLVIPAASGGFGMAGMFAYISGSPFVLIKVYGVAPQSFGWIFGLNALGFIAMSQVNGWLMRRVSPVHVLRRAIVPLPLAMLALLGLSAIGLPPLPVLMGLLFVYVTCLGAVSPNTTAIALAGYAQSAGTASALIGSIQSILGVTAGLTVSLVPSHGILPLAGVMAVCSVMAWWCGRVAADEAPAVVPPPPPEDEPATPP
ncbi:MAG TPA: multidrug effflux MFS transporter [Nevskiaceae bacterium]|nr:multidrug effflux MFS transporter [Nevskiaceae bacterium]